MVLLLLFFQTCRGLVCLKTCSKTFLFPSSAGHAERGYYFPASHVLLISLDHGIYSSATTLTDKAYLLFLLSYVVADEKPR